MDSIKSSGYSVMEGGPDRKDGTGDNVDDENQTPRHRASASDNQREISDNYALTQRLEESLAYFCDEFPKGNRPDVWDKPISHHCGGITPDDLQALLSILYARKPVSLVRCAMALQGNERIKLGSDLQVIAKAVLDQAGVKYVD